MLLYLFEGVRTEPSVFACCACLITLALHALAEQQQQQPVVFRKEKRYQGKAQSIANRQVKPLIKL